MCVHLGTGSFKNFVRAAAAKRYQTEPPYPPKHAPLAVVI